MNEISSRGTIKKPRRRQWRRSGVFIVIFEQISHIIMMFLKYCMNNGMKKIGYAIWFFRKRF